MRHSDWIAPDWPAPENVACITTSRRGGFSQGRYSSLNLAARVGDNIEHVKKNRDLLIDKLQLPAQPVWLDQQHGREIAKLTTSTGSGIQADAAYTLEAGIVCAVLTADCLPVLFCDPHGSFIAVAHAGWRGLLNGVLESTLLALSADTSRLLCWLGPAIGPHAFEVGKEVRRQFITKDQRHRQTFRPVRAGKYTADIYQLARNILTAHGITAIFGGGYCTYSESQRFFSYRRDQNTGRMATMIWLRH